MGGDNRFAPTIDPMRQISWLFCIPIIFFFSACTGGKQPGAKKEESEKEEFVPKSSQPKVDTLNFELVSGANPIVPTKEYIENKFRDLQGEAFFAFPEIEDPVRVELSNWPVIIGDINHDRTKDVLLPYIALGPTRQDSFYVFYLVMLNNGEDLIPVEHFFSGGRESELMTQFRSVNDSGVIIGKQIPGVINKYPDEFDISYRFDGKELVAP